MSDASAGEQVVNPLDGQAPYILYGTSACHLCEIAQEMLLTLCEANPDIDFQKVDISESDTLFERYGVRIPVLRDSRGQELGWPFTADQLQAFVLG